ncbi:DUF2380 domain-containing protein [Phyllobacterium phragmitis]|nr:DUF2380 domain-containing protein [Phyllobacterium phragmitis]
MSNVRGVNRQFRSRSFVYGRFFAFLVSAGAIASAAFAETGGRPALATTNFDFRDTSGEVRDQTAEHEARLEAFNVTLRNGLSENPKFDLVALTCQTDQCTAKDPGLDVLSARAKTAGARFFLFGEIHKMSTLVGWVKFAVLDLNENKPVCDRFMTYRGDTDEAWQHAAKFTVRDIEKHCFP